jgi:hypothetical protein
VQSLSKKKSGTIDLEVNGVPSTVYYCPIDHVDWFVSVVVAEQSVWGPLLKTGIALLLVAVIVLFLVWRFIHVETK